MICIYLFHKQPSACLLLAVLTAQRQVRLSQGLIRSEKFNYEPGFFGTSEGLNLMAQQVLTENTLPPL